MCGPFALACGGRPTQIAAWQLGKLATYVLLGAVGATLGAAVPGPRWLPATVSAALLLWFGAAAAGLVREPVLHIPGVLRLARGSFGKDDLMSRLLFGAANGLLPCGLVYAALSLSVVADHFWAGAAVMLAFGVGTAPLVSTFALSTRHVLTMRPKVRRAVAVAASLAGVWVVARRSGLTSLLP
jgi:sulfite exporter TauE/SafE